MINQFDFCYKGNRPYVQGPDIVTLLLENNRKLNLSQIDIRFNGMVNTGLDLVAGSGVEDAKVNIRWLESGVLKSYQLVESSRAVSVSRPYDEESILAKTQLNITDQVIMLQVASCYTLCENLVAMNKRLLQQLYPYESGKWLFTRLELDQPVPDDRLIEVHFKKNFNFRLTKSDVLVNGAVIGSVYFTLVK